MINKCLFPAAGYGTRFLPATKAVPKEMLPILTKPLLQYGVEEALSAGISNMAIVTGRGKRSIEDHFDKAFELEYQLIENSKKDYIKKINDITDAATFTYVRQKEMLGLGHAILSGQPLIGNEPFAVNLADDLCINENGENILFEMITIFNKYHCSVIAIEEVPDDQTHKYGIISGKLLNNSDNTFQVDSLIEKPAKNQSPSNLAIIGRYILTPDIFEILKTTKPGKSGEIQITDALIKQAKNGKVLAYKHQSKRFDCGSIEGFVNATNYLALKKGIIK
ncbi:UTP--glucose-1-phosphate uridylyltransferase GalU [Candidatus Pseudothioglobus singularis]|uniref:UTP--glucose-1-phosphate uridylyltransferase GalU n=1 Tax=Candidatus Pseudothioglobus singularis TaxID=1427364 RepID=UPI0006B2E9A5|nr:UTP--glucose-1-phosphate uridylyltransferase GalU [Candidatus Pseudothioglobus singularis]